LDSGPAVELEGVTFSYVRGVPILRDVSLRIERGELLFVIGPNGGGKSTLLKVIVGSLKPEKGVVRLFGEDVRRFRDWWMVGYLPQQAATFFEKMALSVEELLSAARVKGRGMGLEDVVRLVGVDEPAELGPFRRPSPEGYARHGSGEPAEASPPRRANRLHGPAWCGYFYADTGEGQG
jgi:energy-coupling factor transporter ATP-binding protein EcfA2